MKRILSLDGGGIRGVLSARLIERLEQKFPTWAQNADLIAGTSTGGILALGLAAGLSPARIVKLYQDRASKIFQDRGWYDAFSPDELYRADYGNEGLKESLEEVFSDMTLGDLGIRVLIPAFDLAAFKPYFIDSTREPGLSVVDVALRTSAAPTYFPSHQGFVDGGVAANNPSDCAVACLQNDGVSHEDITVVSIGTGTNPRKIEGGDWGFKQWASMIVALMMEGPKESAVYRTKRTVGERFLRIDPVLPDVIDLDDVTAVSKLLTVADEKDLTAAEAWFKSNWA